MRHYSQRCAYADNLASLSAEIQSTFAAVQRQASLWTSVDVRYPV